MHTGERPIIAIDGPVGSGKSSTARALARRIGFVHLESGALYRGITLAAIERDIPFGNGERLGDMAATLGIDLVSAVGKPTRLFLNGRDRTDDLRTERVNEIVPIVSLHREVRQVLDIQLRKLGAAGGVVCDGRDIGTSVFPAANMKIFLTADLVTRAARCGQNEYHVQERDRKDQERDISPLRQAKDAFLLDNTALSLEETVDLIHERFASLLSR